MNLVLFASGGLCWRNTQSDRSAGEIVELIRRFWFTGLVFVLAIHIFLSCIFLLAKPKRKNVGRKIMDGSVLKSTFDGLNDDQNQGHSDHV